MKGQAKWILVILLAIVIFAVFVIICTLTALSQEGIFFKEWPVKDGTIAFLPNGLIAAIAENPDPQGEIKAVSLITDQNFRLLAYWYFKKGQPYYWQLSEKGDYVRNSEQEGNCIKCHGKLV